MKKIKIYPVKFNDIDVRWWQIENRRNRFLNAVKERVENEANKNPYSTLKAISDFYKDVEYAVMLIISRFPSQNI